MDELDIWRSANILLKRYRADAVLIAAKRADALLAPAEIQTETVPDFAAG